MHLVTQVLDVTDRHRLETYLEDLALRDPLTGAHNRRALEVELSSRLAADSTRRPSRRARASRHRSLQERERHLRSRGTGDDSCGTWSPWRHRLRRNDVLVRTGGDEFVVLLGDADPDAPSRSPATCSPSPTQRS